MCEFAHADYLGKTCKNAYSARNADVSPKMFKKLLSNLDMKTICVIQHITQLGSSLHLMGSLHAIRSW